MIFWLKLVSNNENWLIYYYWWKIKDVFEHDFRETSKCSVHRDPFVPALNIYIILNGNILNYNSYCMSDRWVSEYKYAPNSKYIWIKVEITVGRKKRYCAILIIPFSNDALLFYSTAHHLIINICTSEVSLQCICHFMWPN